MEVEGCEDKAVRAESTQRSLVLSSRVLVQRACNHSAVEVYRYDADGKLKAAETDITTWEERNTEIYGWLNTDPPPFEPRQPVNRFRRGVENTYKAKNDPTLVADYEMLLDQMATKAHATQPLKSSTVISKEYRSGNDQQPDINQQSNATRVDGSTRSHSEHCVTYKSTIQPNDLLSPKQSSAAKSIVPPKVNQASVPTGRQIWTPTQSSNKSAMQAKPVANKPGFIKPSPVNSRIGTDVGTAFTGAPFKTQQVPSLTSLAERQRKRCMENRLRKASGKQGSNLYQQQQQQLHQQRQWRHVDSGKNY